MTTRVERADASRIQVAFGSAAPEDRWSVAFRSIHVLPHLCVGLLRGIAVAVVVFFGWFCALTTGRLPSRIASYVGRVIQYETRVHAYYWLMLDQDPSFSLDDGNYPVKVEFCPVKLRRLAVLFRLILVIPAAILTELVWAGVALAGFVIWLLVLSVGEMPESLFEACAACLRYFARFAGYALMISSAYPSKLFGDAPSSDVVPSAVPAISPFQPSASASFAPISASPYWWPGTAVAKEPTSHRLVVSEAGKRVVALFLVLGLVGVVGQTMRFALDVAGFDWHVAPTVASPQAVTSAEAIGLQPSDFPSGTPSAADSASIVTTRSRASQCTPVSSQPWLADVYSRNYGTGGPSGPYDESVYSNVVIMPNATDAETGLGTISTTAYEAACSKPYEDNNALSDYTPSKSCGSFTLSDSSITSLYGIEQRGEGGSYRYVADLRCRGDGVLFSVYSETLTTVIGRVFIQGTFDGLSPLSPADEVHWMNAMVSRAEKAFPASSNPSMPDYFIQDRTPLSSEAAEEVQASPLSAPADGVTVRTLPPVPFDLDDPADNCGDFAVQGVVGGDNCYLVVRFMNRSSSSVTFTPADLRMVDQDGNSYRVAPVLPSCYDSIDVNAPQTLKPLVGSLTVQLCYPVKSGALPRTLSGTRSLKGLRLVVPARSIAGIWGKS